MFCYAVSSGHSRHFDTCNVCYWHVWQLTPRQNCSRCVRWDSRDSRSWPLKMLRITHSSGEQKYDKYWPDNRPGAGEWRTLISLEIARWSIDTERLHLNGIHPASTSPARQRTDLLLCDERRRPSEDRTIGHARGGRERRGRPTSWRRPGTVSLELSENT